MKKADFELTKWLPICIIAIILMLIYKTIDNFSQITSAIGHFLYIISPLLYGVLFSYFIYIPHNAIEKLLVKSKVAFISKRARGFTTILIFLVLILVLAVIFSFVVPIIIENVINLAESIPGYIDSFTSVLEYFDNLPEDSVWINLNIAERINESLDGVTEGLLNSVTDTDFISQVAEGIVSFTGEIFSVMMGLVISLYILLDRERIAIFFKRLNIAVFKREDRVNKSVKYISQINKVLFTFIASKGLDSIINFVAATTVLLIFRVPYALLLGLIAGVFNFIPYLGSIISAIIISIITLIACDLRTAIYVMIALLVFHQLDGNYIEPRIMKSSLKISPILVIIAVVIGGAYFGIVGMFLAVPVTVIIKQILLEYIANTETESEEQKIETKR